MAVPSDTNESLTRRIAPRYRLQVPVRISDSQRKGAGTTADMSASGVRVENSNIRPPDGLKIELRFAFFPNSPPIKISAEVVRTTETGGFAARFYDLDWRMQRVLRAILPTVGGKVEDAYDDTASFSGKMVADLGPELHRDCVLAARSQEMSLKDWIRSEMKQASERALIAAREVEEHTSHTLPKDGPCPCPKCLERRS